MASKKKQFVGNAPAKSQVWGLTPPVSANAPTWNLTLNGKTLSYKSTGSVADAVSGMQKLWVQSTFAEFKEIKASVPSSISAAANPQGLGTNEIQALYVSGSPTGGSFQIAWGGVTTPFLVDPQSGPGATDSGSAGNPNGAYKYTVTYLNLNALGQVGETLPSSQGTVTVSSHSITVTVPTGPLGTIGRRIYRTAAGGASGTEKLVATIWDNSTTSYLDNIADGSLGAAQPTANSTGILYNATATQLQAIVQGMSPIGLGNAVVSGSGTVADPWLMQWTNTLGATTQPLIKAGSSSFNYAVTVPETAAPKLIVTEIQQGLAPNAQPGAGVLLLVSKAGVPFYLTSEVIGVIPPRILVNNLTPPQPPSNEQITISTVTPTISVARTASGAPGNNDLQEIAITPNAESGSTFTLTFGGDTTNDIPTPPGAPTIAAGSAGNPNGAYYYAVSFLTASGETEPSAPSAQIMLTNVQGTVTIPTGPSVVTKRRIYRTLAGGAITGPYYLVTTVNDNSTTSYADNNSDATIKLNPQAPSTNGVLQAELEALGSIGIGNVQVSGANASAYLGMTLQQGFAALPPGISTATSGLAGSNSPTLTTGKGGGSLASGTYYYSITAVDAFGETLPGTESSLTVIGPTASVAISWTAVTNAKGYKIYRGTSAAGEDILVGTAGASATSFIDYGTSPAPIVYRIEFIGSLAKAAQSLITGSVANITILPTITLAETQAGSPIQNEVQQIGWTQLYGDNAPDGTFTIGFPSLGVTTDIILWNATEDQVKNKVKAALPAAYANSIAVTLARGGGSGANLANIFQFVYQDRLALTAMPLATINLSGMIPGAGDTVTPYEKRLLVGSPVGRNEIITATINNSPSGGTFGLTGTLANGNTISASGVAYNASAATLQAAFPAATVTVSGSAGGPYTIEAQGEAGRKKVVWTASSSLTGASSIPGSPPATNTTAIPSPSGLTATAGSAGALAAGNYQYGVTATNTEGETTASLTSVNVSLDGSVSLSWTAVSGATGYKVYRGAGVGPNKLIATLADSSQTAFIDTGVASPTTASPPGSSTAPISAPTLSAPSAGTAGLLAAGTYFYKVTATNSLGETTGSNERSVVVATGGDVSLSWGSVSGATGYNVYRGTAARAENVLVASLANTALIDNGASAATSASPPGSNTTGLADPTGLAGTAHVPGGAIPWSTATRYYVVTATNAAGETLASSEISVTPNPPGSSLDVYIALSWTQVTGATGYKIYYGTSSGGENTLIGTIPSGSQTTFYDTGVPAPSSASSPAGAVSALTASVVNGDGQLSAATYYYVVRRAVGTNGSQEASATVAASGAAVLLSCSGLTSLTNYSVYRGTVSGSENLLVGTTSSSGTGTFTFYDTGASPSSASPPGSNTTELSAPTQNAATAGTSGLLATATYYYKITATNAVGETTPSGEQSASVTGPHGDVLLSWDAVTGATGYKIYRGTSAGSENVLVATLTNGAETSFYDIGASTPISQSPPTVNTTGVDAPVLGSATNGTSGLLSADTYYYEVTAYNADEESVASNEVSATTTGSFGSVLLSWTPVSNTTGYNIYRGTSASGENELLATLTNPSQSSFYDSGEATASSASPPASNGTAISAPVQSATTPSGSGGQLSSATYYYKVTATDQYGETTGSNEQSAVVTGPTGSVTLAWGAVTDATGYRIYRGTSAGAETGLVVVITNGATTSYVDTGNSPAQFAASHLANGVAAVNEVQAITVTNAGGGYFQVVNDGQATGHISWNASDTTLQTALQNLSSIGSGNATVSASSSDGQTVYTITFVGALAAQGQQLLTVDGTYLYGGGTYTVSLSGGATDNFTLGYGGYTTSAIAYNASAATIQTDLEGLSSIGSGKVTVSGSSGGPWTVKLDSSVIGTSALVGTILTHASSGAPDAVYTVLIFSGTAGSFTLTYGTPATIPYNATAAQLKTALESTSIGTGNVSVSGAQGGPWTVTITTTPQNSGIALLGDVGSLVGETTAISVYPLVYSMATGPNFWDAAANWNDGAVPAAYIVAAPVISAVTPVSTDGTLAANTHGTLTSGQTYYYKVSATNANGETAGSAEQSAEAFAGAKIYLNGTASGGTFDLTYGGQSATGIAYNASASTIQGDLEGLSSIGSGNCTVTGSGTAADPFLFQLAGSLAGTAPLPLSGNGSSLTGATLSIYNLDTRSLAVSWAEIPTATGYKVYRGTSTGAENVLVATLTSRDQTVFVDDGTYTTTAASPSADANAWHTAVGDDVYFTNSSISCWYNIGADIANGYSIHGGYNGSDYLAVNSLSADSTFTGRIGLTAVNSLGYQEYRPLALELNGPPGGTFSIAIGNGNGAGSPFISLDTGTSEIAMVVNGMATNTGTSPSLLWIGTNSGSEIDLFKGSMGLGIYPGQAWELGTIRQAYAKNPRTDTTLIVGSGGATIPNFYKNGGDTLLSTTVTTLTGKQGTITQDAGSCTTLTLESCTYTSKSTTALGTLKVSAGGTFDRSQDSRPLEIGTVEIYAGATFLDPHGETVTTGQSYLDYTLVQCGYEDVTLVLGKNITGRRTQN